jgi:hypothetical protein
MHEHEQMLRFGGGGETFLTLSAIVLALIAIGLIFTLPRRHLLIPFLLTTFFLPLNQVVVVGGLHFPLFRVLLLFAWIRVLTSGGVRGYIPSRIDKVIVLWAISSTVTFVLLWGELGAFVNRLGLLYNAIGLYFLFRVLHRTPEDLDRTVRTFAVICCVLATLMMYEEHTGRNWFSVFGGVPELTAVREGRVRALGPFAHSILAGTFGAVLLPLFVGLWWQRGKASWGSVLGVVAPVLMVIASASSTPIMAALAGVIALFCWPGRRWMRQFRWAVVITLVVLHMVMKAPVWALIGRVDVVGGSSGYHRFELVNQCILHFSQWWLVGVRYTGDWGYVMHDTSNEYVSEATQGGLITLILFFWIITCCFQALGNARKSRFSDSIAKRRLWSLGCSLFACLAAFFGITFFDQTVVAWYALLAMIASSALLPRELTQAVPQKNIAGAAEILSSDDNLVTGWSRQ